MHRRRVLRCTGAALTGLSFARTGAQAASAASAAGSGAALPLILAPRQRQIAVVGCGAIGLTTARVAQRAGLRVRIYCKDMPPEVRASLATGVWSPDSLREHVIVNCTGYGARALLGDTSVTPVRGQTARLVPQPEVNYGLYWRGHNLAVVSRRDGILVQAQGEHDFGNDDDVPDRAMSEAAVTRLASLFG